MKGTILDFIIIIVYFLGILLFGSWFGRYVKTTKEFFFGGQRFSWWLIAISCIATLVGSYSFIKYADVGYKYGLSSTMSYLNDWFALPFFVLGWLPIIYFSRVVSIPEYFERRFNKKTRMVSTFILLLYLVGYVGINLYTIGIALEPILVPAIESLFGIRLGLMSIATIISVICAIYMHTGGQTSVIMTDLVQGIILLLAGCSIFFLGLSYIGGFDVFWNSLSTTQKLPFAHFNQPSEFNHVGIFWQDAFGSTMAFYFMNQGIMMRFMSAKSPREARKAIFTVVLVMMPLTAFAVSNAGWLGISMVANGSIPATINSKHIFVEVVSLITFPGLFGFLIAALTAALMSTVDTLINAISAISVNDLVKEFVKDKEDSYYLRWARIIAIIAGAVGLMLVPVFASFTSIYEAHGSFTAAITPPMLVTILFGAFWRRFHSKAAFLTLTLGSLLIIVSIYYPSIIAPFDHGVDSKAYNYIRAFFGLVVCSFIGITSTFLLKGDVGKDISGLVIDSIHEAKVKFKQGEPNDKETGEVYYGKLMYAEIDGVALSPIAIEKLKAKPGDIIFVSDARWWFGGLRSIQVKLVQPHLLEDNLILLSQKNADEASLSTDKKVRVEKII
jgi:solute:Na+ symporter, SSS family